MTYVETRAQYYATRREFDRVRDDYYATPFWNLPRRWSLSGRMLELAGELEDLATQLEDILART